MGGCSVFATQTTVFVFTTHISVFGFGVSGEPFFKADNTASAEEIGAMIIKALSSSRTGIETTGRLNEFGAKLLKFAGYRSWRKMERESIVLEVTKEENRVVFMPTKPAPSGGFLHDPDHAISCPLIAEEIGKVFFQMLEERKGQQKRL